MREGKSGKNRAAMLGEEQGIAAYCSLTQSKAHLSWISRENFPAHNFRFALRKVNPSKYINTCSLMLGERAFWAF
jgi:hypothetical protein